MNKNAISWFEIPVKDFGRAKKFYEMLFNFQMPEIVVENDTMGFLPYDQKNGGVGGAIVKSDGMESSDKGIRIYFSAPEDIGLMLERVQKAGGKVVLGKTLITEEFGYYAQFTDTEGNLLAFHSME